MQPLWLTLTAVKADSTAGLPTAVYGLKCVLVFKGVCVCSGVPVEAFIASSVCVFNRIRQVYCVLMREEADMELKGPYQSILTSHHQQR